MARISSQQNSFLRALSAAVVSQRLDIYFDLCRHVVHNAIVINSRTKPAACRSGPSKGGIFTHLAGSTSMPRIISQRSLRTRVKTTARQHCGNRSFALRKRSELSEALHSEEPPGVARVYVQPPRCKKPACDDYCHCLKATYRTRAGVYLKRVILFCEMARSRFILVLLSSKPARRFISIRQNITLSGKASSICAR